MSETNGSSNKGEKEMNSAIKETVLRIPLGRVETYERAIDGAMINQYAILSGDVHEMHMNNEYARAHGFPARIAHGALLVGFMSTASTLLSDSLERELGRANVSLGYDRVRFLKPVIEGDVIKARIETLTRLPEKGRVICKVECLNQNGETVAVAEHIMRFV